MKFYYVILKSEPYFDNIKTDILKIDELKEFIFNIFQDKNYKIPKNVKIIRKEKDLVNLSYFHKKDIIDYVEDLYVTTKKDIIIHNIINWVTNSELNKNNDEIEIKEFEYP